MEKLQYEKPELIEIELNEEIILASGSFCVDDQCGADDCLDDTDCPNDCDVDECESDGCGEF